MEKGGNSIILRNFVPSLDYNEYSSWWAPQKAPPLESLPRIGLIYGDMKAVGFLALTDCDFGILTWWYANPSNKGRESHEALKTITLGLCDIARNLKKNKVFCYTHKSGMIRMLESLNFKNHDGHLIGELF